MVSYVGITYHVHDVGELKMTRTDLGHGTTVVNFEIENKSLSIFFPTEQHDQFMGKLINTQLEVCK